MASDHESRLQERVSELEGELSVLKEEMRRFVVLYTYICMWLHCKSPSAFYFQHQYHLSVSLSVSVFACLRVCLSMCLYVWLADCMSMT